MHITRVDSGETWMRLRVFLMALAMIACRSIAAAQPSAFYVGGTLDVLTQTTSDTNPMGGTTWGGRALVGVRVSPHVALEFEPLFNGSYSWQYSYRPLPPFVADVVVSRRDTFFSGQARIRYGVVETVVGGSYISGHVSRHATIGSSPYFDDNQSDNGLAAVVGVDVAVPLTPHVSFVPTLLVFTSLSDGTNPQISVGRVALRYGAGLRKAF